MIIVHVDDCLKAGKHEDVQLVNGEIRRTFRIKETSLDDYLGINISRVAELEIQMDMRNCIRL